MLCEVRTITRRQKRRAATEADEYEELERSPRDCERSDGYYSGLYSADGDPGGGGRGGMEL